MAVTFISNGYDTTATNPYGESVWADSHPSIGSASYGVRGATDWKVTAVSGQDRTVSIAAGKGFGHGVTDKTTTNDTIQLDTIASGSRWDLIVCRRDWTPTAGVSQFAKVNGGATKVIPGGRLSDPGGIDDQPLALVQVTAGQTQPTAIVDLRVWVGDGGGLVAADDLARSYMGAVGTRIVINGVDWIRRVGDNDVEEWVNGSPTILPPPAAPAGYSWAGTVGIDQRGGKKLVTVDMNITRAGSNASISTEFSGLGAILPVAARASGLTVKYVPVSISGGVGNNILATAALNVESGVLSIRGQSAFTWTTGALFTVNLSYYI